MRLIYLSHPEVVVDPAVPVPDWGLSDKGRARLAAAVARGWPRVARVVSSGERKAREAALILAAPLGIVPGVHDGLGEVDRSSTGYLPHDAHEELARQLFETPEVSPRGWERAVDAQARAVAALRAVLPGEGDLLVVGHGGVGSFTWCALAGVPIALAHGQLGMGSVWMAEGPEFRPEAGWRRLEDVIA